MNKIRVLIETEKGEYKLWKNAVYPLKYGSLLNEQLDYAVLTLTRVKQKEFGLLKKVIINVTSTTDAGGVQTSSLNYFIANDYSYESPVGSGNYTHELALIELTKLLECFPLETLCFTNPKGDISEKVNPGAEVGDDDSFLEQVKYYGGTALYTIPLVMGTPINGNFDFPAIMDFINITSSMGNELGAYLTSDKDTAYNGDNNNITATYGDGTIEVFNYTTETNTDKAFDFGNAYSKGDRVTFHFSFVIWIRLENGIGLSPAQVDFSATMVLLKNRYPLKPWTVADVITRILDVVEPIKRDRVKRFTFTNDNAVFDQKSPEFTFTRLNTREALQTVGGFIHAEPKLNADNSISYTFYGGVETAKIKNYANGLTTDLKGYRYRTYQGTHNIDQACNALDCYIQNIVNRKSGESDVVSQPYINGAETLRTESFYLRLAEDDTTVFLTSLPIDKVAKFEVFIDDKWEDITKFVFEATVYSWLSSWENLYPTSKSYGLSYTQGEKNISGFFYKVPDEQSSGKNNYSIVNILNSITGNSQDSYDYFNLQFRLTYEPIYSTRVRQSKQYITSWLNLPRTLNYAQSDNSVEASYFGENIKGAVERLGTIEKTIVFNINNVSNIPIVGTLFDEDYYISSVSVEVQNDLFVVACGLSKNFNRRSKYIGANSHKRIYEVSEKMVQERHTIYTDYLVFTKASTWYNNLNYHYLKGYGLDAIRSIADGGVTSKKASAVLLRGASKSAVEDNNTAKPLNAVLLPVIASSFGNQIEFTWEYRDNYSAGIKAVEITEGDIIGHFGQAVEYGDYYGRLYWQNFALLSSEYLSNSTDLSITASDLPFVTFNNNATWVSTSLAGTGYLTNPILTRKDSREKLKESYCIEFVTDNEKFIIGSALASLNPLVNDSVTQMPKLYLLSKKVNKFATRITQDLIVREYAAMWYTSNDNGMLFSAGVQANDDGQAWAVAFPISSKTTTVEDEDGNEINLTEMVGGEIVVAENVEVTAGDTIGAFRAFLTHDVYYYLENREVDSYAENPEPDTPGGETPDPEPDTPGGGAEGNTVNITFYVDDILYGSVTATKSNGLYYADNWVDNPTKENYTFNGWYTGRNGQGVLKTAASTFSGSTSLYAYFEINEIEKSTVTFKVVNSSNVDITVSTKTTNDDGKVSPWVSNPNPAAYGYVDTEKKTYEFMGWYTGRNGQGTAVTSNTVFGEDITVYAYIQEFKVVDITFNIITFNGETILYDKLSTDNKGYPLRWVQNPNPADYGYTTDEEGNTYSFAGWCDSHDGIGGYYSQDDRFNEDITLYAIFDIIPPSTPPDATGVTTSTGAVIPVSSLLNPTDSKDGTGFEEYSDYTIYYLSGTTYGGTNGYISVGEKELYVLPDKDITLDEYSFVIQDATGRIASLRDIASAVVDERWLAQTYSANLVYITIGNNEGVTWGTFTAIPYIE